MGLWYLIECLFIISYLRFTVSVEDLKGTKPFINEFFFKVTDEKVLSSVQKRASDMDFVWLKKVIPGLHLFRKTDIPSLSQYPVSEEEIAKWMNGFGNSLEYITQDKYEQIYPVHDPYRNFLPGKEIPLQTAVEKAYTQEKKCSLIPQMNCKQSHASTETCSQVKIAVLDAFFDISHQNLHCNVMLEIAYNFVDGNTNLKPMKGFPDEFEEEWYPAKFLSIFNHGTMCMGRIASSAEHGCSEVGDTSARLVPLKFIDEAGNKRNENEIEALKYRENEIDIYSCSYGLKDNIGFPKTKMEHVEYALAEGAAKGRNCKGSIYLFPSGNGHGDGKLDNCNTDIYAKSINTIAIASITMSYKISEETEVCPAALVATFGNPDTLKYQFINTTKPGDRCTFNFRGTSAATAYAAGMVSHALRENENFSKRDIEHMLVQTSDKGFDETNIHWKTNGAGLMFNDRLGFGAINVTALKSAAKTWKHVPEKRVCHIDNRQLFTNTSSRIGYKNENVIKSDGCRNTKNHVKYLEHVELKVNISCSNISELAINLISPMGTKVGLLTKITVNNEHVEYKNFVWSFMTVHLWGENPDGDWLLQVVSQNHSLNTEIGIQSLILHGTEGIPSLGGPRLECLPESSFESDDKSSDIVVIITVPLIVILIGILAIIGYKYRGYICKFFSKKNGEIYKEVPLNTDP